MFTQSIPLDSKEAQSSVDEQLTKSFIQTMQRCNFRDSAHPGMGVFYAVEYKALWDELKPDPTREVIRSGLANFEFWEMTGPYQYTVKGKKPSEAILAFLAGPAIADCASVITICFYAALLDVIGEKKFNELFKYPSLTIKQNFLYTSYQPLVNAYISSDVKSLRVGAVSYIRGVENYLIKHPMGAAQGWNVVKVGEDNKGESLFAGFGFSRPLSYSQIKNLLLENYNRPRNSLDIDEIKRMDSPKKYDTYQETAEEIVGFESDNVVVEFNTSAVLKYLNSNIKDIRQIFLKDLANVQPTEVIRAQAEIKKDDHDRKEKNKKIIGGVLAAGTVLITAASLFYFRHKESQAASLSPPLCPLTGNRPK